jgi:hypothetical protein
MSSIASALRAFKSAAPKMIRRPLHAPSILRSHLSAQTASVLAGFFDTQSDGDGTGPEFHGAYPAPPPPRPAQSAKPGSLGAGAPSRRGTISEESLGLGEIFNGSIRSSQLVSSSGLGSGALGSGGGGSLPGSRRGSVNYVSDLGLGGDEGSSTFLQGSRNSLRASGGPLVNTIPVRPESLESDAENDVKYVQDILYRLDKYYVSIHKLMIRRGVAFDTFAIKQRFVDKHEDDDREIGFCGLGILPNDRQFKKIEREWYNTSLIWVCVKESEFAEPTFYSHVGQPHRFHHSTFTGGGKVIAAGEWIVLNGALRKINANSGHYRPPLHALQRAVLFLKNAWRSDSVVVLFNTQTKQYEEVPIERFAHEGSRGGLYTSVAAAMQGY